MESEIAKKTEMLLREIAFSSSVGAMALTLKAVKEFYGIGEDGFCTFACDPNDGKSLKDHKGPFKCKLKAGHLGACTNGSITWCEKVNWHTEATC